LNHLTGLDGIATFCPLPFELTPEYLNHLTGLDGIATVRIRFWIYNTAI